MKRTVLVPFVCLFALGVLPAPRARAESYVIKLATVAPDQSPWAKALKQYRARLKKKSGGRIKLKLFLGGTLGDENETVQACKRGQIQAVGVSVGSMATMVPELAVLEMAYLFRSPREADKVLDNPDMLAKVEALLNAQGFTLLFWSENGFRSFGSKFGFIKSPADLEGRKMRSQESDVHLAMWRAFGASPVPVAVTEVLTNLGNNVVEGFDNTPLFAMAASWHQGIQYLTVSNHVYQPALIALRKEYWDGLPEEIRTILLEARGNIPKALRARLRRMAKLMIKNFEASNVQVYRLNGKEKKGFYAKAKLGRRKFLSTAGDSTKAFYKEVARAIKKARGR